MSGLVTQDFQVEFDGLLFGVGTPYALTDLPGFLDLAGVRAPMTQRARATGGFIEPHYGAGATRDLDFTILGTPDTTFADAVAKLRAWTYPQLTTRPLWFQLPGQGLLTGGAQVVNRAIPSNQDFGFGLSQKASVQFYFPDPLWSGATVTSAPVGLPTTSGGLPYPLGYPLPYGTTVSGRYTATNVGSADVSPVFTVVGPQDAPGFQITSLEDGITLTYVGALGATDVVVINTADGSVALNGTDRRGLLSYSAWPVIPAASLTTGLPGVRTFVFTTLGSYNATTTMTVTFAPAFW